MKEICFRLSILKEYSVQHVQIYNSAFRSLLHPEYQKINTFSTVILKSVVLCFPQCKSCIFGQMMFLEKSSYTIQRWSVIIYSFNAEYIFQI